MKKVIFLTIGMLFLASTLAFSATIKKVKVSSDDTSAGFLNGKLVAGNSITFTENNGGGNETLTIAALGSDGSASNQVFLEGATKDAFETILDTIDPTADRTFNFPDDEMVAGDVLVSSDTSDLEYLNLATTQILIGDGAGVPTAAALSGDATMTNAGVVTVVDDLHAHVFSNIDATTSANWKTVVNDETGSGAWVFATSPTLVTPVLGTIASGVGTALTALNGENIQDDTIDDDSIDFADVTAADLTLTDAGAITSSGLITSETGLIDSTGGEAFLVRANADSSDVFIVDTTNEIAILLGDGTTAAGTNRFGDLDVFIQDTSGVGDSAVIELQGGTSGNGAIGFSDTTGAEGGISYSYTNDALSFNGLGTNSTMATLDSSGLTLVESLIVPTGKNITLGANTLNSGDLLDMTQVADADLGDIGTVSGVWSVEDDSHAHVITNIDAFTEAALETQLSDVSNVIVSTEVDAFSELNTLVSDKTLVNEEDAITLDSLLTTSAGITNGGFTTLSFSTLTISAGAVTATKTFHQIDTESAAASDDLDTITAANAQGDIIVLETLVASRDVTVKHGTGNIRGGADCILNTTNDKWMGIYNGSEWDELSCNNGV